MYQSVFMQDHIRNRVEVVMGESKVKSELQRFGIGGVFGAVAIIFAHALIGMA